MTPPLAPVADLAVDAQSLCAKATEDGASRSESINALAALLLDWRVDCERHLRGLTNLQRWLERVRCSDAGDGERELLLQEMGRVLHEAAPKNDHWQREAETYLNRLAPQRMAG
jgi:hypothetical protein